MSVVERFIHPQPRDGEEKIVVADRLLWTKHLGDGRASMWYNTPDGLMDRLVRFWGFGPNWSPVITNGKASSEASISLGPISMSGKSNCRAYVVYNPVDNGVFGVPSNLDLARCVITEEVLSLSGKAQSTIKAYEGKSFPDNLRLIMNTTINPRSVIEQIDAAAEKGDWEGVLRVVNDAFGALPVGLLG